MHAVVTTEGTPDQVVLLAYGPVGATRAALRRVRRIVGPNGTIIAVAVGPAGRQALGRSSVRPTKRVEEMGAAGVRAGLEAWGPGPILVLHDDAIVHPPAAKALMEAHTAGGGVIAEGLDARTADGACLLGRQEDLLAVAQRPIHLPGVNTDVARAIPLPGFAHQHACVARLGQPRAADGRPLIVAAIITRDEESTLPDCIASLEPLVDRIVVCDTGSTDATVRIAEEAGADVIRRIWRDDFGWARNEAAAAADDAHFVVAIDADERIVCADPTAARRVLSSFIDEADALLVETRNIATDRSTTSTFRATRVYRPAEAEFQGALHEIVVSRDATRPIRTLPFDLMSIDHHGYRSEMVAEREKAVRNLEIARRQYSRVDGGREALELARSLRAVDGDPVEAEALLREALAAADDRSEPVRAHLLASLAAVRLDLGDDAAAFALGAEALDLAGDDLALAIHATAAARLGNWESLRLAVRQVEAGIRPRGVFEIPRNRSRAAALAAAAAAHLAEHAEATDRAAACITRFGEFRAWPELVAAVADQAAERAIELLLPIALEDPGTDFARIAAVGLAPSTVGLLCLRWVEAREPATEVMVTGIAAAVIAGDAPTAEALAGRSGGFQTQRRRCWSSGLRRRAWQVPLPESAQPSAAPSP